MGFPKPVLDFIPWNIFEGCLERFPWFGLRSEGCLERFALWQSLFSRFWRMSRAESLFHKSAQCPWKKKSGVYRAIPPRTPPPLTLYAQTVLLRYKASTQRRKKVKGRAYHTPSGKLELDHRIAHIGNARQCMHAI